MKGYSESAQPELGPLYERVWDEADYVVPPAENGAFFVTTNVVITPNQTWGSCPEVRTVAGVWLINFEFPICCPQALSAQDSLMFLTRRAH